MSHRHAWFQRRAKGMPLRLALLPLAATLLLAAADGSTAPTPPPPQADAFAATLPTPDLDQVLAPMSAEDAAAAAEALAASTPVDERLATRAPSLAALVDAVGDDADADAQIGCLATAVFFEARGEPLEGQLAVAKAIVNRSRSGRYADTFCGVVRQPGQFSFARARAPRAGDDWRIARAIARIAADDLWTGVAPDALSFHAVHVSPGWRGLTRVARIGNHIFYR